MNTPECSCSSYNYLSFVLLINSFSDFYLSSKKGRTVCALFNFSSYLLTKDAAEDMIKVTSQPKGGALMSEFMEKLKKISFFDVL